MVVHLNDILLHAIAVAVANPYAKFFPRSFILARLALSAFLVN